MEVPMVSPTQLSQPANPGCSHDTHSLQPENWVILTLPHLQTQLQIPGHLSPCYLIAQLCPTLLRPHDCSPPGSSSHRISQARILEWIDIPFFRRSSWLRDWTHISCIGRQILYHWATWKTHSPQGLPYPSSTLLFRSISNFKLINSRVDCCNSLTKRWFYFCYVLCDMKSICHCGFSEIILHRPRRYPSSL